MRRGVLSVIVAVTTFGSAIVGCSSGGSSSAPDPCPVLVQRMTPSDTSAGAGIPDTPLGALLPDLLAANLVVVYLDPDADDAAMHELADAVESEFHPVHIERVDKAASWAKFVEMFADNPQMQDSVSKDTVPTSIRVTLSDPSAARVRTRDRAPAVSLPRASDHLRRGDAHDLVRDRHPT